MVATVPSAVGTEEEVVVPVGSRAAFVAPGWPGILAYSLRR
jgi:hypothetical protein